MTKERRQKRIEIFMKQVIKFGELAKEDQKYIPMLERYERALEKA